MIYSVVMPVYKTTFVQNKHNNNQHLYVGVDMSVVSTSRVFHFQAVGFI